MEPSRLALSQCVSHDVCDDFSTEAYLFMRENLIYLIEELSDVVPGVLRETLWRSLYNKVYHFSACAFFGTSTCEQLSANLRIVFFPENMLGVISHDIHSNGNIYPRTWSDIMFDDIEDVSGKNQHVSIMSFNEEFKDKFEWYIDTYSEWAHSEEYEMYKSENWVVNESQIFLKNTKN